MDASTDYHSNTALNENNWTAAQTFNDDVLLTFGTDNNTDWDFYHNGADMYFQSNTGGLTIGLGASAPAPDNNNVHIWKASAGTVTAVTNSYLNIEGATPRMSVLAPNNDSGGFVVGFPADNDAGQLFYMGPNAGTAPSAWRLYTASTERLRYSAGAFAFQEDTIISTSEADLTLNPAANLVVTANTVSVNPTVSVTGGGTQLEIRGDITTTDGTSNQRYLAAGGAFGGSVVINSAGAHGKVSTLELYEPNIDISASNGTVATASTLYIGDAPTEGTAGNYALFVDAGNSRFDGDLLLATGGVINYNAGNVLVTHSNHLLTYTVDSGNMIMKLLDTGDSSVAFYFDANRSGADAVIGAMQGNWNGSRVADITFKSGADNTAKDEGRILFRTNAPGGTTSNVLLMDENQVSTFYGDLDMANNTISNVGGAGSDWTATNLNHQGANVGSAMSIDVRNTDNSNAASHVSLVMVNGGASGGDVLIHQVISGGEQVAIGLDNSDSDIWKIGNGSNVATNTRLKLVPSTGVLSVDGDAGGADDPVGLFDKYDDAMELRRFQLSIPNDVVSLAERNANRQRMVDIGVGDWAIQEDGSYHFMQVLQPLNRLFAGGIYQNRELINDLEARLTAIGA